MRDPLAHPEPPEPRFALVRGELVVGLARGDLAAGMGAGGALVGRPGATWPLLVVRGSESADVDDAEAVVEGVAVLDRDRLGKAAGGDGEAVEEADAAE